jgi:hypothetical protein
MSAQMDGAVRREGAGEVLLLAGLVVLLLVGAYLSWTRKDDTLTAEKVNINTLAPERVTELVWSTRTQTVAVSRKKAGDADYVWFDVKSGKSTKGWKGNKAAATLFEQFAPFVALRSLGTVLDPAQLTETKLERPDSKLIVRTSGDDKVYEAGGRTFGSRDWYLRAAGGKEVFVVASKVLQDLDFAESKYMQRDLTTLDKKDVASVVLKAGPKEQKFLQQNKLSPTDAFWTRAEAPDAKDESVANYLRKVEGLKALSYAEPAVVEGATRILDLTYYEEEAPKETLTLYRGGEAGKERYYVVTPVTVVPVEVAKSVAEQLEQDLAGILNN